VDWKREIEAAERRIRAFVRETPLEPIPSLGATVYAKLENMQVTGSFKARGGVNKLLTLTSDERARGVVAASSGNHGAAVAFGAESLNCSALVCVPTYADPAKIETIKRYGAEVQIHGNDCVETEGHARGLAQVMQQVYISPYNDPDIVCGQGTIGVELLRQLPQLDAVFVAVGGGGMISGIGAYLKACRPEIEIIACSPEQSPAMHVCLQEGLIVDVPCHDTLSDATAGGVEEGAITFELCREVIDRSLLVGEDEIRSAMVDYMRDHHMWIEGAAGVALAGFRQCAAEYSGKNVAIIICGANIGMERMKSVLGGSH
jgi:threonine dehydratase